MQKISTLLLCFFCFFGWSQTVNLFNPDDNSPYPATQYFCAGEVFKLKVDAIANSTGDYGISQVNFNVPATITNIPFSNKVGNDHFSQPVTIPFNFEFFGKQYSQVVVGSNGRLLFGSGTDFNNLHTVRYKDQMHSGNDASSTNIKLPNTAYHQLDTTDLTRVLNFSQIFFGFTDIGYYNTTDYNKLTYGTITYNGKTGILFNFNQVRERTVNGGYATTITSQVLLLSDNTYIIKVTKSDGTANAIIGIQNESGTNAKWPANSEPTSLYNNGKWSSTTNSAWVFTPNQNLTPQFKWFRNGAQIPGETTNTLLNFVPNDGDILKVEVTYHNPSGVQVGAMVSDQITFKQLQVPQVSPPNYSAGCGNPATLSVINPDPALTYEWFSTTNPSFHQTGTTVQVGDGTYYVQVKNTNGTCIVKSTNVVVAITSTLPPFTYDGQTIRECDNTNFGSKTFNLATVTGYPTGSTYSVVYNEVGNTASITSVTLNSGETKNFTITVSTNAGVTPACTFTKNFSISYLSFPANNQVFTSQKLCDNVTNYTTTDFINQFYPGKNYQTFFSTDGVNFNLTSVNPQTSNSISVKLSDPNFSCNATVKLNFSFNGAVTANTPNPNNPDLVQCASATQTYDLHALFDAEINPGNVTITYHTTLNGAQTGDNSVPNASSFRSGLGDTTLYIRVVDNLTGCVATNFPSVTLTVYQKPQIIVQTPIVLKNCAGNNIFNLTQNVSTLTNAQPPINPTLQYYSQNGTLLTAAQVSNYNATTFGLQPYIRIIYNSTCDATVNFDLQYNPKPTSLVSQILICNQTTYTLQDFKNSVIANPANYTFTDDLGNPLPANFNVSVLPKTVKFIMKDNATGCLSDIETVTFVKGMVSTLISTNSVIKDCDDDFDGKRVFDLSSVNSDFTNLPATFEYFKDAAHTQKITDFTNYTNETPFSQTIYVSVTNVGFCPADAQIQLTVNIPTKSTTLDDKYFICYGETLTLNAGPDNTAVWSSTTYPDFNETGTTVNIAKPGNYSVKLTNAIGCSYTHNFVVSDENQPKIEVINQTNNQIEVIANGGAKPYTYYFNGVPQSSNILMNPTEASYTIQVESATGCLGEPKTVYFIKINNAFTPNADGINDFWTIENLDKMENVSLIIVDRSGAKVFESKDRNKMIWDGKNYGKPLPTSSYWYTVTWYDSVTQKTEVRQGWILLKNRN